MTNEGIDVEKEAGELASFIANKPIIVSAGAIQALCARVRAETEAVVTKREREKQLQLFLELRLYHKIKRHDCDDTCGTKSLLAAYESNDAGGSKHE